jgi:hypothetical protein
MAVARPLDRHAEARLMQRFHHGSPVRVRALVDVAVLPKTFQTRAAPRISPSSTPPARCASCAPTRRCPRHA